ncbi:nucleobase:cation symporter-2 family protein [Dongshaea marina]|uniref:nucleobase:cation symporter-2 family protein n=1 Tax=Dongshaea marina TaxID=2047966 RepID=UPI00227766D8|nr:nucleobase:cation symporter-2 family protein [Dongshaea marina]
MMGTSFAFIGVAISVGTSLGMAGIIGSALVGSVLMMIASRFMQQIRRLFPPAVTGTVILLIGLSILPVAVDWLGGGHPHSATYASGSRLLLGLFVLLVVILAAVKGKGLVSASAIMIGVMAGYLLSLLFGLVNFEPIVRASWFRFPELLGFGVRFEPSGIITIALVYLVMLTESTGNYLALGEVTHTRITGSQLKRGILCDGVGGFFASLIGSTPPSSFSQNVGIVSITGVASRHVVAWTGVMLLVAGLLPKLGALMVTIPEPVLGGAGIVMFGMVTVAGVRMMARSEDSKRSAIIIAVGVSCGMAVTYRPEILRSLPHQLQMIFGSGITTGALVAVLLHLILPGEGAESLQSDACEEGDTTEDRQGY